MAMDPSQFSAMDPASVERLSKMYGAAGGANLLDIKNRYKLGTAQLANAYKIALMESGDKRAAIEATREYQRGLLEQARQEMERVSIPKVQIDQFLAQANTEIARGELQAKQYAAQGDVAYKQGVLQQQRDEMLQLGIPKLMVDRFVAESNAAIQRGELGLKRDEMLQLGIPDMLTRRYSAEAQSAYEQGQLGLTAQQQQQQAIEQQRRYALDVAKYGTELASTPDRYFQAQQFAAMAPRLLGLQQGAGPTGGPTPGINQMGSLLAQATEGLQNQATPYEMPQFPTMQPYQPPPMSEQPGFPTMPAYQAPPLGPMPTFPTAQFGPMAPLTTPWGATVPGYPGSPPAPAAGTPGAAASASPGGGVPDMRYALGTGDTLYAGGGGGFDESGGQYAAYGGPAAYKQSLMGGDLAQTGWYDPTGQYGAAPAPAPLDTNSPSPREHEPRLAAGQITAEQAAQEWQAAQTAAGTGGGPGGGGQLRYASGGGGGGMTTGWYREPIGGQAEGGFPNIDPATGGSTLPGGAMTNTGGGGAQNQLYDPTGALTRYAQAGGGGGAQMTGTGTYGGPSAGARPTYAGGAPSPNLSALQPDEQSRYHQLTARKLQLQQAGQAGAWTPEDEAELGRYHAKIRAPSNYGSADPRQKQLAQIAKASPPSPFDGLNESDAATLKLMESIYKKGGQGIQGGEMERMSTAQKGFMGSAGRLLGYDPDDLARQYQAYRPAQGAASLAG